MTENRFKSKKARSTPGSRRRRIDCLGFTLPKTDVSGAWLGVHSAAMGDWTIGRLLSWWNDAARGKKLMRWPKNSDRSVRESLEALLVGLSTGAAAQFAVLRIYSPKADFQDQLLGVPLFALIQALNVFLMVALIYGSLRVTGLNAPFGVVATLTCYAFAATIPFISILMVEQFNEAIRLHNLYGDPSLPYMEAAAHNLLFPQQATVQSTVRAWILLAAEVGIVFYYYFVALRRGLTSGFAKSTKVSVLVVAALILACALDILIVRPYLSRGYWAVVTDAVSSGK